VSLFLRSDTTTVNGFYRLDTIAHGLSPTESTYSWVVPDTSLDSARITAVAYGPGWQFDESDSTFAISPEAVDERASTAPLVWSLSVSPNPAHGAFGVCLDVPRDCHAAVRLYDVGGRLLRSIIAGRVAPGRYEQKVSVGILPAGVYFVEADGLDGRMAVKVQLSR